MSKKKRFQYAQKLGVTSLLNVTDQEIFDDLLTPQVKAHLGSIVEYGEPQLMVTMQGHFPGDEATNLNGHKIVENGQEVVRFPYLSTLHKTQYGALVIKRDATKVKAMAWVGDVMNGKGEMIFLAALRDRRFDGTQRANDSALVTFAYDDPKFNSPLSTELACAEISIYGYLPGSRVLDATGELEFDRFVANPFTFLDRPELFKQYFERAWKTNRAPGQFAAPIADVSKLCLPGFERIAKRLGYDILESAVSHYHVAHWFRSRGFRYTYDKDVKMMAELGANIKRLKDAGRKLTRPQESWLCVLQSLRPTDLIPEGLFFNGPVWSQDNIGAESFWMSKPLTERGKQLLQQPLSLK